uniref:Single stranded DNA binding protein 4 n=1 Tax=Heterorhabditis bacteriophora TaxID=37862 RepID=A0A1I7WX59_HETBA
MRYGGPPFMDSPGQAFAPSGMMPNGGVMCSQAPMSMSSPGIPPASADGHGPPSFMMGGMPTSSSSMPVTILS